MSGKAVKSKLAGSVLRDIAIDAPVFLTKNGRGPYAIIDIQDYERAQAALKLMDELSKGKHSEEENGWLSPDDVKAHFQAKMHET